MSTVNLVLIVVISLCYNQVTSLWSCRNDTDCSTTDGAVCVNGDCVCPAGQQIAFGGSRCVASSPYHTSSCFEDHQCESLVTSFECRKSGSEEGHCFCQEGFHYYRGRCWRAIDYGGICSRDEECMGVLRDPFSLICSAGVCGCAEGYYERQRGECRKIGFAVGDGCVLNEDCQFENGICDSATFRCVTSTLSGVKTEEDSRRSQIFDLEEELFSFGNEIKSLRQHGVGCDSTNACQTPFICSRFGHCVCPTGYYPNSAGTQCLAELGSPSTPEQCLGLLAQVIDGVCKCPANIYYEQNMRDCVKATRRLTDSCVSDQMCHTFGAAVRCTAAGELPWFMRQCQCLAERAVWDEARTMCRLFVGIGESCQADSDCLAGDMEITCEVDSEGQGVCVCPPGLTAVNGLCLTSGLQLGESCQVSQECTGTPNSMCYNGTCACDDGYQQTESEDGSLICAPTIGGTCVVDADCSIENTVCVTNNVTSVATCQCNDSYVEYNDICWPGLSNMASQCEVSAQCQQLMGEASHCVDSRCGCRDEYHSRDGRCWPRTGLFQSCQRTSECYLSDISERVECRNSLCQCHFEFPYSEELQTCTSSSTTLAASILTTMITLTYVML